MKVGYTEEYLAGEYSDKEKKSTLQNRLEFLAGLKEKSQEEAEEFTQLVEYDLITPGYGVINNIKDKDIKKILAKEIARVVTKSNDSNKDVYLTNMAVDYGADILDDIGLDDNKKKNLLASRVEQVVQNDLSDQSLSDEEKKKIVESRLKYLSNLDNFNDKSIKGECMDLIQSGYVDAQAMSEFLSSGDNLAAKKFIVKEAVENLANSGSVMKENFDKFKKLLDSLPPEFIGSIKKDLVNHQKAISQKIKDKKAEGGGKMITDIAVRIKNFFKSEPAQTERMMRIEMQKSIGKAIRNTDASVIPQYIRSKLGMIKKGQGRQ